MSMTKDERLQIRVDPAEKRLLERAAAASHVSVSAFVLQSAAAQAAEVLGPRLAPGESVLDAGCGGGYYLWSFLDRGFAPDWHGLDFTPEMIELAGGKLRRNFRTRKISPSNATLSPARISFTRATYARMARSGRG